MTAPRKRPAKKTAPKKAAVSPPLASGAEDDDAAAASLKSAPSGVASTEPEPTASPTRGPGPGDAETIVAVHDEPADEAEESEA
jgi:hypothetical protein